MDEAAKEFRSLVEDVSQHRRALLTHPIYAAVDSPAKLCRFMEGHVFAVWDFMSLAKRLQRDLTCIELPWRPPHSAAAARFINELITSEESDLGPDGKPASHFELYVAAMEEVGASTGPIREFIRRITEGVVPESALLGAEAPEAVRAFVAETLHSAMIGSTVAVAAAFLFGREDVIPEMFAQLLEHWGEAAAPHFAYYLRRHIELDSEAHGPLAERLLQAIAGTDAGAWLQARAAARGAIESRLELWDRLLLYLDAP